MLGTILLAAAIGGPFPLLCTPYTEKGEVDCAVLAKEARFVADRGANGVIWPAAKEAINLLTAEEERQGLEAIAAALEGRDVWFCPCCPGTNTADAVRRVEVAEEIAAAHPKVKMTMLVRMADDGKGDDDYRRHYEAVAEKTRHPVILQTYNGIGPLPSASLLVDLAKRHPETYGWYKVEGTGAGIVELMEKLIAARPTVKMVFTGWGGRDWLYHYRRVGTRGVITQRPQFTGLLSRIWDALEKGSPEADALFAKHLSLRNLNDVLSDKDMRGWNLYVLKKLGVFTNTLSRTVGKDRRRKLEDVDLRAVDIAEIDARLEFAGIE